MAAFGLTVGLRVIRRSCNGAFRTQIFSQRDREIGSFCCFETLDAARRLRSCRSTSGASKPQMLASVSPSRSPDLLVGKSGSTRGRPDAVDRLVSRIAWPSDATAASASDLRLGSHEMCRILRRSSNGRSCRTSPGLDQRPKPTPHQAQRAGPRQLRRVPSLLRLLLDARSQAELID